LVDTLTDRNPSRLTINRARLTDDALPVSLRSFGYRPLGSRLEDAGSSATMKVAICVRVLLREAGLCGVVAGGALGIIGKREVVKRGRRVKDFIRRESHRTGPTV